AHSGEMFVATPSTLYKHSVATTRFWPDSLERLLFGPKLSGAATELLPILTKQDITRITQDINRRPARPNERVVVGGGGFVKCHIRKVTGDRAANSAHFHNGI